MKFTEKYEIQEMLTSGRISTFRARDRASQEPVLVHTFECSGAEPLPSSTAAILMKFATLGPNPPGSVLKAGLDEESSSAYLVTRMPNTAVLQEWIHAYRVSTKAEAEVKHSHSDATAEMSASEVDRLLAQSGHARPQPSPTDLRERREITEPFASPPQAPVAPPSGGEFTRLFQELGAFQPRPGAEKPKAEAPVKPAPPPRLEPRARPSEPPAPVADFSAPPAAEPESFTQLFSSAKKSVGGSTFGPDATPAEPSAPSAPGSFTQQFLSGGKREFEPSPETKAPSAPKPPGPFTQEFLLGDDKPSQSPDASVGRLSGEKSVEKNSSTPASPMFGGMFGATPSESGSSTGKFEFAPEPEPAKESAGEFTQFFRSPFEQPGAPSRPLEIPDEPQVKPAREQTGDFTRVFGKGIGEEVNEAFRISPPQSEPPQPAGSFTRIFGEGGAKLGTARLDTGDADPGSFQPLAGPTAPPVDLPPAFSTRPPLIPQPPPPTFTPPPVTNVPSSTLENSFLNRSGRSDATEVFKTPGGDAAPEMQGFSSGPSEFTQFLSRSQINAALPPEPAIAPPPAPSGSPFGAPAIPKPPAFQFAPPPPPPPPAVPAIPRPAFAVPQPPAVKAPAGPTSYWPLITVLTILLAVAIILIMYFALKH